MVGTLDPGERRFTGAADVQFQQSDGAQVAFLTGTDDVTLLQPLVGADGKADTDDDPRLETGATYLLTVAVGSEKQTRDGAHPSHGFELALLADNKVIATVTRPGPAPNTLTDYTLKFTADSAHPQLGRPLAIRTTARPRGKIFITFIDNVRLTKTE